MGRILLALGGQPAFPRHAPEAQTLLRALHDPWLQALVLLLASWHNPFVDSLFCFPPGPSSGLMSFAHLTGLEETNEFCRYRKPDGGHVSGGRRVDFRPSANGRRQPAENHDCLVAKVCRWRDFHRLGAVTWLLIGQPTRLAQRGWTQGCDRVTDRALQPASKGLTIRPSRNRRR